MDIQVITSSKTLQPFLKSSSTIIVITGEQIRERGYHHLEEILHDIPGFDFNKSYGVLYSTIYMRGYRSENSDRFILLYDGIIENDIWKQTNYISRQYPVSNIERIEILYGPASALWGTNAFSGIINVITKPHNSEKTNYEVAADIGSYGMKNFELSGGWANKKNDFNARVTIKYYEQDKLHPWPENDLSEANISDAYNTALQSVSPYQLLEMGGIRGNTSSKAETLPYWNGNIWADTFYSNGGLHKNRIYIWNGSQLEELQFKEDLSITNWSINPHIVWKNFTFSGLIWETKEYEGYFYIPQKRFGRYTEWFYRRYAFTASYDYEKKLSGIYKNLLTKTTLSYRKHMILDGLKESSFKYKTSSSNGYEEIDPANSSTFQFQPDFINGIFSGAGKIYYYDELWAKEIALEEQINLTFSNNADVIIGGVYSNVNSQKDYIFSTVLPVIPAPEGTERVLKKNIATYNQITYPFEKLGILTIGSRYEMSYEKLESQPSMSELYHIFVPRAAFLLNSIDKWIFRFQYGKAFQAADDWHKYATDPGVRNYPSLDLQPEKITSYEISATFIPFGEMLVTASIFKNDIDNLISPGIDVNDNPYYTNKSKAEIIGYEISYRYNIKNTFIIDANFSGAKNEDGNGREIGDIAKIKANIGVMCRFFENSLQITPKINYVGKKLSYGRGLKPSSVEKIDDYAILGINCRYLLKGTGLEFNIKIDNLLNKKYYNPGPREADGSKYPAKVLQPGFNMLIGIRYRI